jgi:hypothetical protein
MMNRRRPIPRRSSWERTFFRDGNQYTQNDAPRVPDHEKTKSDKKLGSQENTVPCSVRSDDQRSDQPVASYALSPTRSLSSSTSRSFASCTEYVSQQEESPTSPVPSTSTSSSRRPALQRLAEQRLAIHERVEERLRQLRATYALPSSDASTTATHAETDSPPQQHSMPTVSSHESYHQHTDRGSRLSQNSSVYSRGKAHAKSWWTMAKGRRGQGRDEELEDNDTGSTWNRSRFRSRKTSTTLTGLSNMRQLIQSKWETHFSTKFTRTNVIHY